MALEAVLPADVELTVTSDSVDTEFTGSVPNCLLRLPSPGDVCSFGSGSRKLPL